MRVHGLSVPAGPRGNSAGARAQWSCREAPHECRIAPAKRRAFLEMHTVQELAAWRSRPCYDWSGCSSPLSHGTLY
jgi:hypothetical protein